VCAGPVRTQHSAIDGDVVNPQTRERKKSKESVQHHTPPETTASEWQRTPPPSSLHAQHTTQRHGKEESLTAP
jgi:hypothetical protein